MSRVVMHTNRLPGSSPFRIFIVCGWLMPLNYRNLTYSRIVLSKVLCECKNRSISGPRVSRWLCSHTMSLITKYPFHSFFTLIIALQPVLLDVLFLCLLASETVGACFP